MDYNEKVANIVNLLSSLDSFESRYVLGDIKKQIDSNILSSIGLSKTDSEWEEEISEVAEDLDEANVQLGYGKDLVDDLESFIREDLEMDDDQLDKFRSILLSDFDRY